MSQESQDTQESPDKYLVFLKNYLTINKKEKAYSSDIHSFDIENIIKYFDIEKIDPKKITNLLLKKINIVNSKIGEAKRGKKPKEIKELEKINDKLRNLQKSAYLGDYIIYFDEKSKEKEDIVNLKFITIKKEINFNYITMIPVTKVKDNYIFDNEYYIDKKTYQKIINSDFFETIENIQTNFTYDINQKLSNDENIILKYIGDEYKVENDISEIPINDIKANWDDDWDDVSENTNTIKGCNFSLKINEIDEKIPYKNAKTPNPENRFQYNISIACDEKTKKRLDVKQKINNDYLSPPNKTIKNNQSPLKPNTNSKTQKRKN